MSHKSPDPNFNNGCFNKFKVVFSMTKKMSKTLMMIN